MDLKIINTDIGQKILSAAIFEDVMALMVLGIILNAQHSDKTLLSIVKETGFSLLKLGIFFFILSVSYKITKKLSKKPNYLENGLNRLLEFLKGKESLFALFFVFVLLFAAFTETLGFHFIIGAFFASLLISKNLIGKTHHEALHKTANGLAIGFLAPIFFASIGLEFNFSSIHNYVLLIAVLLASYLSKIAGGYIGGRMAKLKKRTSFSIGIGLNARGIMELVIANIAYKSGLINLEIFSILIIMGVLTTLTTPSMLKWSLKSQKDVFTEEQK
jgi:Kef-type K+ transport system membrane component KefB